MSAAYPISRGTAPVLASIAAVGLLGEPITVTVVAGVLLVSLGTLSIALRHHSDKRTIFWAMATGATIADSRCGPTGSATSLASPRCARPRSCSGSASPSCSSRKR